ncbi:MAG: hypothetical protein HKN85_09695 [Gammaproteobacteria bacterium]|nr:hypothetical protein [Gammaproteobacteria bacterium]
MDDQTLPLRSPRKVMDLRRLGSMHQSRLSFMRALIRRMMLEQWQISLSRLDLDERGYGTVVYTITTTSSIFSYVLFSHFLADEDRNDRVIADKWDVTMALCIGEVNEAQIADLRANVPRQEAGRMNSQVIVLSRGNKSMRNFEYVVDELAAGRQPAMQRLAEVGYLYRTTAVYGSGKFGMADWEKVKNSCADFAHPFAAEMFNCYMLRQFSIEQVEFQARIRSPDTAVPMDDAVKRYMGIGNSTGLGMAPYLIRHPRLISQWVLTREKTLARVIHRGAINRQSLAKLDRMLQQAITHVEQTVVAEQGQIKRNNLLKTELAEISDWLPGYDLAHHDWNGLIEHAEQTSSLETQEMINSLLIELYPELLDGYEEYPCVDEHCQTQPQMPLAELKMLIESRYDWALEIDFDQPTANHYFWYRSEEKMEPRLGDRRSEAGEDREMPLTIARLVRQCYDRLCEEIDNKHDSLPVAWFLAAAPAYSGIVKRIQAMSEECYGEIRANLADKEVCPLDLLRCKLSFFGVSKFDPKSRLWVRNTMFQGAPIVADIGKAFADDWYFPVAGENGEEVCQT